MRRGEFDDDFLLLIEANPEELSSLLESGDEKLFEKAANALLFMYPEVYMPRPMSYCATDAKPGSKEKKELLRKRLEMGKCLWHYDDPVIEYGPVRVQFAAKKFHIARRGRQPGVGEGADYFGNHT